MSTFLSAQKSASPFLSTFLSAVIFFEFFEYLGETQTFMRIQTGLTGPKVLNIETIDLLSNRPSPRDADKGFWHIEAMSAEKIL